MNKNIKRSHRYILAAFLLITIAIFPACSGESETKKKNTVSEPVKPASVQVVADKAYMDNALHLIRSAEDTLHICQLYMNEDGAVDYLLDELKKASRRGVKITAVVNRGDGKSQKAIDRLKEMGAKVTWETRDGYGKIHAKLIVADREQLLLGSTNWSAMSIYQTNEVNLQVGHRKLADHYARWIEALASRPTPDPELKPVKTQNFETLTGRQISQKLPDLLKNSTERLWLGIYIFKTYFEEQENKESAVNEAARLLAEAQERGVDVRVILEKSDYADFVNKINRKTIKWLEEKGIEVRRDPESKTSHWKLLIADDQALVSSMNWGHSGFDQHAEAGLLTTHPRAVSELSDYFLNLWKKPTSDR